MFWERKLGLSGTPWDHFVHLWALVLHKGRMQCDYNSSGRYMFFKKATVVEVPQSLQKSRTPKLNLHAEI